MDDDTIENIRYKFELKKLIGNDASSNNAINTEIRSDPWVIDLDLSSTPSTELEEDKVDNNISYSDLYSKDIDETKLLDESVDLYNDLVEIEEKEKKAKQNHEAEFKNCKKELRDLKKVDALNKKRIEELTNENSNLKRSISSLYRTVKREIEFKDNSLAEANAEVIRLGKLAYRKNGQIFKNERCSNCENDSINSKKDSNTSKRKRSKSPESSSKKKECKSSSSKTHETDLRSEKDERKRDKRPVHETTKSNHSSDLLKNKDKKDTFQKHITKHDKDTQTSYQCVYCQLSETSSAVKNSKGPREINNVFFNLLPDSLKESFYEYEQNQFVSLNKLKEAFVDEYFDSVDNVLSPILESTPKSQDMHTRQLISNVSENRSSPSTIVTPKSSFEHSKRTEISKRIREKKKDENITEPEKDCAQNSTSKEAKNCNISKDCAQNRTSKESKNCNISRSNKKDLISLFMYRKEKIPFTEKKKFELHKDDKNLIPKKLL